MMRPAITLTAVAAMLALDVAIFRWEIDVTPITPHAESRVTDPPADAFDARVVPGAISEYAEVVRRPLFQADRRPPRSKPPAAIASAAPRPAKTTPQLRLLGVLVAASGNRAFVATPVQPSGTWLKTGDAVDGWTIGRIEGNGIVIEREGASTTMPLHESHTATPR